VTDPELISEIGRCVSLDMGKPKYLQKGQEPIFGAGILKSNGACWARQRKVISPEFYMAKVRAMVPLMVDAAQPLLRSWEAAIDGAKGGGGVTALEVDADIRSFSFDVISRACFGTDHSRGKEIFLRLRALSGLMAETSVIFAIPSLRYLPTEKNRRIWRLTQEIRSLILELARGRRAETAEQRDFLSSIIESSGDQPRPDDFVVDNCKNIFFAGHETSAVTATWCLMLLAAHPEWQERARAEVLEVCGGAAAEPDFDMVSRMKTLGMVVQETLRLFPPSSFVVRETFRDMRLGRLHAPKGTYLFVPISAMHHDAASWGPTSRRFDPGRFKDGVAAACKHPQAAFMPFGLGARTCLGQNLAIVEVKTLLAVVLARFAFTLSPDYRHSPAFRFIIEPEFGLRLLIRRVGATQDGCN
jgi:cytochrome P450